MLSNLRLEGWHAVLSNGDEFDDNSSILQTDQRSPWRELERIAIERNLSIVSVTIFKWTQRITFESNGYKLVTGTATHSRINLSQGKSIVANYRWVRREKENVWEWGICNNINSWIIETPPGVEMCPDPYDYNGVQYAIS